PFSANDIASLVKLIDENVISTKIAKEVFANMAQGRGTPAEIVEKLNLRQINDPAEIEAVIDKVMQANPQNVEQYRAGKDKLFGFFVGHVMKETGGRANPDLTNELLLKKLK
ncbi:MAG: hypothetical protein GX568_04100, partial [Candidatus Gastranaerophilales bacterium]|nr:hypothetical protein [Candidatus Gastranaerophilales bacterium]